MDWTIIITVASIIGTVANIYKKKWCFIIWLFTNSSWMVYDFYIGAYAQSLLFAVYTGLAVWGLYKWAKEEKEKQKPVHSDSDKGDVIDEAIKVFDRLEDGLLMCMVVIVLVFIWALLAVRFK